MAHVGRGPLDRSAVGVPLPTGAIAGSASVDELDDLGTDGTLAFAVDEFEFRALPRPATLRTQDRFGHRIRWVETRAY